MGKLLGLLGGIFMYLCVGTVVATAAGFVYLRATGKLDDTRLERVLAAAKGQEPKTTVEKPKAADAMEDDGQSIEEQRHTRDLQTRNVEIRERIISDLVDNMKASKAEIEKTSSTIKILVDSSLKDLAEQQEKARNQGIKKFKAFIENDDPKQAKQLLVNMLKKEDEAELESAVACFTGLSPAKQVEIAAEFSTPSDLELLDMILNRIRRGEPDTSIINQTKEKLTQ
jgi:hypothetical protein